MLDNFAALVALGHDLETAILLVAGVERHPCCYAAAGPRAQVVLVLVQRLAECARRRFKYTIDWTA